MLQQKSAGHLEENGTVGRICGPRACCAAVARAAAAPDSYVYAMIVICQV